ncbi:MAG: alpha/beta fold hydrolase [Acidobacteriota bacterium]
MIVALHGFSGSGASWSEVRRKLPSGLLLEAPTLPGHRGPNPILPLDAPLPESFEATVDRVADWIDTRRGDARVDLVGYSLGARLALGVALERSTAVRSLLLIGVRAGLDDVDRRRRAAVDDDRAACIAAEGWPAFVDRWERMPLFASQRRLPAQRLDAQRRIRLEQSARGMAWALQTLSPGRMPDQRPRLHAIRVPWTLLVGALDGEFRRLAEAALDGASSGRLEIVEGGGHNVPLEMPAAVASAIEACAEDSASPSPSPVSRPTLRPLAAAGTT